MDAGFIGVGIMGAMLIWLLYDAPPFIVIIEK